LLFAFQFLLPQNIALITSIHFQYNNYQHLRDVQA